MQLFRIDQLGTTGGFLIGYPRLEDIDLAGCQIAVTHVLQDGSPKGFRVMLLRRSFLQTSFSARVKVCTMWNHIDRHFGAK
ncbi:hypothetical protein [Halomonas piscis]|uniref:hypothetical protein n=1 Tax=Halomonas piscis TaxID=3031727 RepID=UPI0028988BF2|nr:hypothetical protein [Halomonas piscis]